MLLAEASDLPRDYLENQLYDRGYRRIAGVDEAGRGPLAGPVVAAAVVLPKGGIGLRLFDSKKISSRERERLYELILSRALGVGTACVDHSEIDRLNIHQATLRAMVMAVKNLPSPPDFILIDGIHGIPLPIAQRAIPKGDDLCDSISAASIVAKVTRDRIMLELHKKYPCYNFARHKGYGTKEHLEAIKHHGICEVHRKTFKGVKEHLCKE